MITIGPAIQLKPVATLQLGHKISARLKYSLNILALPAAQLNREIEKALEENPLLEEVPSATDMTPWRTRISKNSTEFSDWDAESLVTLYEHLSSQWKANAFDPDILSAGHCIIENVDEEGYLKVSLEMLSVDSGYSLDRLQTALPRVQQLEPSGVAARNLSERLLLQLNALGMRDSIHEIARRMVSERLKDLPKKNISALADALDVEEEDAEEALDRILSLDPKPCASFCTTPTLHVIPDLLLIEDAGEFKVELNEKDSPRLRFQKTYETLLSQKKLPRETRLYLRGHLASGRLLLQCIEQRKKTLIRVGQWLVSYQKDFLVNGGECLKPLSLRLVSLALNLHMSTISRTIKDKTLQTPWGILRLKDFFSNSLDSHMSISSKMVKSNICSLIRNEHPGRPLSDQKICVLLRQSGFPIARRTVMKYRESMRILPSYYRKKH